MPSTPLSDLRVAVGPRGSQQRAANAADPRRRRRSTLVRSVVPVRAEGRARSRSLHATTSGSSWTSSRWASTRASRWLRGVAIRSTRASRASPMRLAAAARSTRVDSWICRPSIDSYIGVATGASRLRFREGCRARVPHRGCQADSDQEILGLGRPVCFERGIAPKTVMPPPVPLCRSSYV